MPGPRVAFYRAIMRNPSKDRLIHLPLALTLCFLGCGPVDIGDGSDRAIQVVLEETGYKPFG
jgi:hypothetical protein